MSNKVKAKGKKVDYNITMEIPVEKLPGILEKVVAVLKKLFGR